MLTCEMLLAGVREALLDSGNQTQVVVLLLDMRHCSSAHAASQGLTRWLSQPLGPPLQTSETQKRFWNVGEAPLHHPLHLNLGS